MVASSSVDPWNFSVYSI
jgi:hypothetical protein